MRSTVIFFGFCLLASRSLGQQNELKEQSQVRARVSFLDKFCEGVDDLHVQ